VLLASHTGHTLHARVWFCRPTDRVSISTKSPANLLPFVPGAAKSRTVTSKEVCGVFSGKLTPFADLIELPHSISLS
jgi:hypothetical protein